MINLKNVKKFCKNDISLIENYDKAIADKTQVWDCHHRRETIFSKSDLIEIGEYYNRPACELIFLTPTDHRRLHNLGKHTSEETKKKNSEAHKGKPTWNKGKHLSAETRKKLSEANKGKSLSEETRKKLSEANKGKHLSEETRKKMSESKKGSYFFNNGVICVRAKTCPEGFVPGRIK